MFSKELLGILEQVLQSWQVWAVTIAVAIFFSMVNSAARPKLRSAIFTAKPKKKKTKAAAPADVPIEGGDGGSGDSNDELGLEEG